ncbi:hypothetical protein [Clostridium chrysemydis]|uniref:hypothetical protein n=1 Tax=Clostridium chrysemydis TaxID=2665504 RepID=UPI0018845B13|nr:hypothetical protein [Clostridium chrysemydis]
MLNRINKIDDDARRKIIEKTKDGKVHKVKKAELTTEFTKNIKIQNNAIEVKRRYVTIDCEKNNEMDVDALMEVKDKEVLGFILDKRR